MDLNANIDAVRRLLQKPKAQFPNTDTILGAILDEVTHLENELGNAGTGLNLQTITVSLGGKTEYTLSQDVGKILFVTSDEGSYGDHGNYGLEFTDLRDASEDWWQYSPVPVPERPEDYGYWHGVGNKIAFYREGNKVKMKVPATFPVGRLTIKVAKIGSREMSLSESASLPSYHSLINVRAAQNVIAGAMWSDDAQKDENMRRNLMQTLPRQESRYYDQFIIAKRSPNGSDVVILETDEW